MSDRKKSIEERLERHPELKAKFESLLDIAEDAEGDLDKADDAEERIIEELREMGREILADWAKRKERESVASVKEKNSHLKNHSKKKSGGTRPLGK